MPARLTPTSEVERIGKPPIWRVQMVAKTNRSNILHSVEVCGEGDEANDEYGGEGHPRGVYEITSSGQRW